MKLQAALSTAPPLLRLPPPDPQKKARFGWDILRSQRIFFFILKISCLIFFLTWSQRLRKRISFCNGRQLQSQL